MECGKLPDPNESMHAFTNCGEICKHGVCVALGRSNFIKFLSPDKNRASKKNTLSLRVYESLSLRVCESLSLRVCLHAPRLASLLGAGAGSGTRALLGASSTGGTSGTSAPPGTLLTRPVMPLLSLAGDRGVVFGFTSTFRLASLGARS